MENEAANLVELVELLQSIDASPENIEKNAFVLYDGEGNKIIL